MLGAVEHSIVRTNPDSCITKGTFFISHLNTSYMAVSQLHARGQEIGVNSITRNTKETYWARGSYDDWVAEMAGQRLIVEKFANITDGSVVGVRVPDLAVGGDTQFNMMYDQFFAYDASIVAPPGPIPIWPYTLQNKVYKAQFLCLFICDYYFRCLINVSQRMVVTVPKQVSLLAGRFLSTLSILVVILAP